jgi:hypothetical protein
MPISDLETKQTLLDALFKEVLSEIKEVRNSDKPLKSNEPGFPSYPFFGLKDTFNGARLAPFGYPTIEVPKEQRITFITDLLEKAHRGALVNEYYKKKEEDRGEILRYIGATRSEERILHCVLLLYIMNYPSIHVEFDTGTLLLHDQDKVYGVKDRKVVGLKLKNETLKGENWDDPLCELKFTYPNQTIREIYLRLFHCGKYAKHENFGTFLRFQTVLARSRWSNDTDLDLLLSYTEELNDVFTNMLHEMFEVDNPWQLVWDTLVGKHLSERQCLKYFGFNEPNVQKIDPLAVKILLDKVLDFPLMNRSKHERIGWHCRLGEVREKYGRKTIGGETQLHGDSSGASS